jgi:mRNA interferase MazF
VSDLWPLVRGRVYAARLAHLDADKYFLVVSNNQRNRQLPQVLAVRLTTTPKPAIPSVVELAHPDPFTGRAVCDDIVEIYQDEVRRDLGALAPITMAAVSRGLKAALAL